MSDSLCLSGNQPVFAPLFVICVSHFPHNLNWLFAGTSFCSYLQDRTSHVVLHHSGMNVTRRINQESDRSDSTLNYQVHCSLCSAFLCLISDCGSLPVLLTSYYSSCFTNLWIPWTCLIHCFQYWLTESAMAV
jgi:hypothetical protein